MPGGREQLYMQLNAAVDAAYYFNPVQRYTVHNAAASRPYQAVFETGVEGCYNDASDFVASGPCAPYFGYHWYLYNNVTGTTALDVNGLGYLSFGYPAVALSGITSTQYLTEVGSGDCFGIDNCTAEGNLSCLGKCHDFHDYSASRDVAGGWRMSQCDCGWHVVDGEWRKYKHGYDG